ncbi:hypothetical protein V8F06_013731 [Rhypophila decipiens]
MRITTALWRLCLLTLASARPHSLSPPVTASNVVQDDLELPVNTTATSTSWIGPLPVLLARARNGQDAQPLLTPDDPEIKGRGRQRRQLAFMDKILSEVKDGTDEDISITPTDEQLATWRIDDIAIGATAFWFPWPTDRRQTYKMRGLTGCTASLIFSEHGFWAAHHWESVKETNTVGGSSFNVRIPPSNDIVETPVDVFKKIAVDILDSEAPPGVFREFESFTDLKSKHGDPLSEGDNVDIFVLTKANGPNDKKPRYDTLVKELEKGYRDRIPGARYAQETYVGDTTTTRADPSVRGRIVVQYTPHERDDPRDDCGRIAKVAVWVEEKSRPVLEKEWETE